MRLLKRPEQNVTKLTTQQNNKVREQLAVIHFKILNSNSINRQGYECQTISPYTKDRLVTPVMNSNCKQKTCVWELQDILQLIQAEIKKKKMSGNNLPLQVYECPLCSSSGGFIKSTVKVDSLYINRDLQLAIRIAQEKFFRNKNRDKKNNKIFNASQIKFHRNGQVLLHYQTVLQKQINVTQKIRVNKTNALSSETMQQIDQGSTQEYVMKEVSKSKKLSIKKFQTLEIMPPSLLKKNQNIYYNPSDYKYNKDGIKIAHRILQKLIINKCKKAFESIECFEGAIQTKKDIIWKFGNTIRNIYQKNIAIKQIQDCQIAFKFVRYYSSASIELLTYYPRHKSQNVFCIKNSNGTKFVDIKSCSQALIDKQIIYIVSEKTIYSLDLRNTYTKRFQKINKTMAKTVKNLVNGDQVFKQEQFPLREMISPPNIQYQSIKAHFLSQTPKYQVKDNSQIFLNRTKFINPALVIVESNIYWFGAQMINSQNETRLLGQSWKLSLKNSKLNKKYEWHPIESIPQEYVVIESTVVYDKQNSLIYLIGGRKNNQSNSTDIIQYSIKKQQINSRSEIKESCYKIYEKAIRVNHYQSKCIVTRSVYPNLFMLFDARAKENCHTQPNYVKIFDCNTKKIEQQFLVQNIYARCSDIRNEMLLYTAFPAMPAYYQGINYFWARSLNTQENKKSVLIYGTDNAWCVSEPDSLLI